MFEILSEAPNVNPVVLYSPKHGINCKALTNAAVNNQSDPETGRLKLRAYYKA